MDQLIIQWLGNRESERHNTTVERETERHNKETEKETRRHNWNVESNQRQATQMQYIAAVQTAQTHAAATRYASDNARRAQEYAASTNAAASRYASNVNYWNALQHEATARQANAIQRRFNEGKLAIAASEFQETRRSNLAREQENRLSRLSSYHMKEKELEYKYSTLAYEKERDWLDRGFKERAKEADLRMQMSHQVLELLGDALKAKSLASKGGNYYGQSKNATGQILTQGRQEESPQEFWKRLNEGFDRELAR